MLELLRAAMKGGVRTSEFWLSVIAMVLPFADNAAAQKSGTVGVIASAVVAATYAASRAWVKGKATQTVAVPAASEAAQ